MITNATKIPVESYGTTSQSQFRIKTSRKSFEILSSGLYANKIKAVIRELCTNAYDSHVAAGCASKPFEVHLPTRLEPWFAVQDFGIGLSPEKTISTYTCYFESDKTDSNDFTGALGLGSKSPFCYTDSFSVTSVYDGVKISFTAFLNEDGTPTLAHTNSEPTDEGNGVLVQLPVAADDFTDFKSEGGNVLQWFKVKPGHTGAEPFKAIRDTAIIATDSFDLTSGTNTQLVMGNVCYPVRVSRDYKGYVVFGREFGLTLFADIGDVEVTASREALQYGDKTEAYLEQAFENAHKAIVESLQAEANKCSTLWDYRVWRKEKNTLIYNLKHSQTYRGHVYASEIGVGTQTYGVCDIEVRKFAKKSTHTSRTNVVSNVVPYENTVLVVLDGNRKLSRYKHIHVECPVEHTYVISETEYAKPATAEWLTASGLGYRVVRASTWDVPKAERADRDPAATPRQVGNAYLFYHEGYGSYGRRKYNARWWGKDTIDIKAGGYYVVLSNYIIQGDYSESVVTITTGENLRDYLRLIFGKKAINVPVYGVNAELAKRLEKVGKWKNVLTVGKTKIERLREKYAEVIQASWSIESLDYYDREPLAALIEAFKKRGVALSKLPVGGEITTAVWQALSVEDNEELNAAINLAHIGNTPYRKKGECQWVAAWSEYNPRIAAWAALWQKDSGGRGIVTKKRLLEAMKLDATDGSR